MTTVTTPTVPDPAHLKKRLLRRKEALEEEPSVHVVNQVHHDEASFGEQLADRIASGIGSWRFLIVQSFIVICWMTFNALQVTRVLHFDPVPYILLNLAFST